MRELSNADLASQAEAFQDYRSRGGPLSFEEWMDRKDFTREDRCALRAIHVRQVTEVS